MRQGTSHILRRVKALKVLIVDDELIMRKVMRFLLQAVGGGAAGRGLEPVLVGEPGRRR